MYRISSPQSIIFAGEWNLVEKHNNPSIIMGINKRVFVEIEQTPEPKISVEYLNIRDAMFEFDGNTVVWKSKISKRKKEEVKLIKSVIETVHRYLGFWRPFELRIWKDSILNRHREKIDISINSAITVALVTAFLSFNGFDITNKDEKDKIYKLSVLSRYNFDGKMRSGFDIAGSVYGGLLIYKRFKNRWFSNATNLPIRKIVDDAKWDGLYIECLNIPKDMDIIVWYSDTKKKARKVLKLPVSKRMDYKVFIEDVDLFVNKIINGLKTSNKRIVLEGLRNEREIVKKWERKMGLYLENKNVEKLISKIDVEGAVGKSLLTHQNIGFAVCFDMNVMRKVKNLCEEYRIYPLDINIDHEGTKLERVIGI